MIHMPERNQLYRSEALTFLSARRFGTIEITQPPTFMILTIAFTIAMAALVMFLITAEYSRKQTVVGYIEPMSGVTRIRSLFSGVTEEVFVSEGDAVTLDQPLVLLSAGKSLNDGASANMVVLEELLQQKNKVITRIQNIEQQEALDLRWFNVQTSLLEEELQKVEEQIGIQSQRVSLFSLELEAISELSSNALASGTSRRSTEASFLAEKHALAELEQEAAILARELEQSKYLLQRLPYQMRDELTVIETELSRLNTEIAQTRGQAEFTLKASSDGIVTAVNIKEGDPVALGLQTMAIISPNSPLQAVLLAPSRAIGFVEIGQSIKTKFDSFPYQKFGSHEAKISVISEAPILPSDITGPVQTSEPVYLIYAELSQTNIPAYGQSREIQPSMRLNADIILERRTLIEWVLEPLYSLRGRTT